MFTRLFILFLVFALSNNMFAQRGYDRYKISLNTDYPKLCDTNGKIKSIQEFVADTCTQFTKYDRNGERDFFLYNSDSFLVEKKYDQNNNLIYLGYKGTEKIQKYDSRNRLIEKIERYGEPLIGDSRSKVKINSTLNNIAALSRVSGENKILYYWKSNQNYTKYVLKNKIDTIRIYNVELNKAGKVVYIEAYYKDWSTTFGSNEIVRYNQAGYIKEITQNSHPFNGQNYQSKTNYKYDKLGRLISVDWNEKQKLDTLETTLRSLQEFQYLDDSTLTILYRRYTDNTSSDLEINSYDKYRNLVRVYIIDQGNGDGYFREIRYKYKYDEKGNWIEQIKTMEDGKPVKTKRIITYYE